jgi:hypothetical protein
LYGLLRRLVWCKFTDVSEVLAVSVIGAIALAMGVQHDATTQKTAILSFCYSLYPNFAVTFA